MVDVWTLGVAESMVTTTQRRLIRRAADLVEGIGRLRDHIVQLKAATSGLSETLNQRALADFIASGEYDRHLERILPVYRTRRDSLMAAIQTYFPPELRWTYPAMILGRLLEGMLKD